MADTAKNQRAYLQMSCHKPAAASRSRAWLASSRWPPVRSGHGHWSIQGQTDRRDSLLRRLLDHVSPGTILLADRYYATYWLLAAGEMRGIDLVVECTNFVKSTFAEG